MTKEQLAQLKKMTRSQIARKYTPLRTKGVITHAQYMYLMSQASDKTEQTQIDTAVEIYKHEFGGVEVSDQTTHTDKAVGKTQKARLLNLLMDGKWHDTNDIMLRVYRVDDKVGRCAIPQRIYDLRKEGHAIEKAHIKSNLYKYRLIQKTV
jgi:biotin operon repressor